MCDDSSLYLQSPLPRTLYSSHLSMLVPYHSGLSSYFTFSVGAFLDHPILVSLVYLCIITLLNFFMLLILFTYLLCVHLPNILLSAWHTLGAL
jgi:hypothetical protein